MDSLFAPKAANIEKTNNRTFNQQPQIQNDQNTLNYVQTMLQRSGGDAKAAFYLAAKEKGVNPEMVLNQVRSIKDPRAMIQNMLMSNPQMQSLMSLFSMKK